MPSPEQLKELQKLLPQVAAPDTTLAVINGRAVAAKDLIGELRKMPTQDIASLIEDLKTLDKPNDQALRLADASQSATKKEKP